MKGSYSELSLKVQDGDARHASLSNGFEFSRIDARFDTMGPRLIAPGKSCRDVRFRGYMVRCYLRHLIAWDAIIDPVTSTGYKRRAQPT